MTNTNNVTITGYLGLDPLTGEKNGNAWARFRIANNRSRLDREGNKINETTWHNVSTFNGTAKAVRHLAKGDRVTVTGRLMNDTIKVDDRDLTVTVIRAHEIEFQKVASLSQGQPPADLA
jgi:single-strand DNA-binding protein